MGSPTIKSDGVAHILTIESYWIIDGLLRLLPLCWVIQGRRWLKTPNVLLSLFPRDEHAYVPPGAVDNQFRGRVVG
jgi:hypothetical protein